MTVRCDIYARHRTLGEWMTGAKAFEKRITAKNDACARAAKKPYDPPKLVRYGDVRDVTLGPSPGTGESGQPLTFKI